MEEQNMGSFGAPIGGSQALKNAMERRGMDLGALQVQSPASAGGAPPVPTQPNPSDIQGAQAALGGSGQTTQTEAQPNDPELAIALEGLSAFVKSAGQTRRDLVKARTSNLI